MDQGPLAAQQPVQALPAEDIAIPSETEQSSDAWKLFVGQIPRNIRHDELVAQFAGFGELEEVFIIRDQATGLSKGCCFVRFRNKSSADACVEAFNDKVTLPGASNPLQISFAAQHVNGGNRGANSPSEFETKLFVGQIPPTLKESDLSALFEPYGVVREVFIMRHRETGLPKGAGFVRLEGDPANVKRAIIELNGRQLEGATGPIKVDVAHQKQMVLSPRSALAQSMMAMGSPAMVHRGYNMQPVMAYPQPHAPPGWFPATVDRKSTQNLPKLFVGGLTPHTTETQLFQIFSHYGHVREVVILRFQNGQSKSSGFVKYSTEEEADIAVASLSNRYYLPESTRPISVRYAGANNPPEHKLFVGHLPPHFEEAQTRELFEHYGDISEVHVMRDPRGQTKGSAFVKYLDRNSAEMAIQALHNSTTLGGDKPLKVSFAYSKGANPGMMGQPGMMQQMSPTSMANHQQQMHQQQQHNVRNAATMMSTGTGGVISQGGAGADHMHMQQAFAQYGYYPQMAPFFSLPGGGDGSSQLPVSF